MNKIINIIGTLSSLCILAYFLPTNNLSIDIFFHEFIFPISLSLATAYLFYGLTIAFPEHLRNKVYKKRILAQKKLINTTLDNFFNVIFGVSPPHRLNGDKHEVDEQTINLALKDKQLYPNKEQQQRMQFSYNTHIYENNGNTIYFIGDNLKKNVTELFIYIDNILFFINYLSEDEIDALFEIKSIILKLDLDNNIAYNSVNHIIISTNSLQTYSNSLFKLYELMIKLRT